MASPILNLADAPTCHKFADTNIPPEQNDNIPLPTCPIPSDMPLTTLKPSEFSIAYEPTPAAKFVIAAVPTKNPTDSKVLNVPIAANDPLIIPAAPAPNPQANPVAAPLTALAIIFSSSQASKSVP